MEENDGESVIYCKVQINLNISSHSSPMKIQNSIIGVKFMKHLKSMVKI